MSTSDKRATDNQIALALGNQRWRERATKWVDPEQRIDPGRYTVQRIHRDLGRAFVEAHHYSGSSVAERYTAGLYRGSDLVGAAVFSQGVQERSRTVYFDGAEDIVELGRLVLLDDVPGNGESWFVARAMGLLRNAIHQDARTGGKLAAVGGVLSYSDPLPRTTVDGETIMPGHVGTVYQALSARCFGRASPRTVYLTEAGTVLSGRGLSKIGGDERGRAREMKKLLDLGAPSPWPGEDFGDWQLRALHEGPFRRVRHPGNFVYGWALASSVKLAAASSYPKKRAA